LFDQERAEITDKKNKAYKMMVQKRFTRAAKEEYGEARREEKETHKIKKIGSIMKNNLSG
jgi:hypothetical protein